MQRCEHRRSQFGSTTHQYQAQPIQAGHKNGTRGGRMIKAWFDAGKPPGEALPHGSQIFQFLTFWLFPHTLIPDCQHVLSLPAQVSDEGCGSLPQKDADQLSDPDGQSGSNSRVAWCPLHSALHSGGSLPIRRAADHARGLER